MTKYFRTALTAALLGFAALPALAQPSPMVAQPDAQTTAPDTKATAPEATPAKVRTHHHKPRHHTANTHKVAQDSGAAAPAPDTLKN